MAAVRVLIIDDEENMRHMLQTMLNRAGYETEVASDGVEGLRMIETGGFDFVLCDLKNRIRILCTVDYGPGHGYVVAGV